MKMKKLFWPLMLMMLLINIVTGCGGGGGGKKSGENKGGGPFASLPPDGWVNYLGAVAQVGQKIYFIGGTAEGDQNDMTVYDMETDTWSQLAPMPTARYDLGAVVIGAHIYALGGRNWTHTVEYYDTGSNQWDTFASDDIPEDWPMFFDNSNQFVSCNGKIYAVAKTGDTPPNYAIYEYDGTGWSSHVSSYPADLEPALTAENGKLYILGGDDNEDDTDPFIEFDPDSPSFNLMSSHTLQANRGYLNSCFSFNNKIYKINTS